MLLLGNEDSHKLLKSLRKILYQVIKDIYSGPSIILEINEGTFNSIDLNFPVETTEVGLEKSHLKLDLNQLKSLSTYELKELFILCISNNQELLSVLLDMKTANVTNLK